MESTACFRTGRSAGRLAPALFPALQADAGLPACPHPLVADAHAYICAAALHQASNTISLKKKSFQHVGYYDASCRNTAASAPRRHCLRRELERL